MPERLFKIEACPATGMEFSWIYRLITDQILTLNYSELEGGDWVDEATLGRMLANQSWEFAETFDLIWQRYQALIRDEASSS